MIKDMGSIRWAGFSTCEGWMGVAFSPQGLVEVVLPQENAAGIEEYFRGIRRVDSSVGQAAELRGLFQAYFSGRSVDFAVAIDLSAYTPFQQQVWQALRLIPRGQTRSYRWVAETVGKSLAARAVGQAVGRNPLPVVVPCHRVIAADGTIGGFTGGLDLKRKLLALEGVWM